MQNLLEGLPKDFQQDILSAVKILKEAGCGEIFLFGSLASGQYHADSDIDLAVKGLTPGKYFEVGGQLMILLKHPFHLIKLDDPQSRLAQEIQKEALIRVA